VFDDTFEERFPTMGECNGAFCESCNDVTFSELSAANEIGSCKGSVKNVSEKDR
jgi:hypothetical protein